MRLARCMDYCGLLPGSVAASRGRLATPPIGYAIVSQGGYVVLLRWFANGHRKGSHFGALG